MRFVGGQNRKGRPIDVEEIDSDVERICREKGLLLLYLHGSYATGRAGVLSDVDLAVLGPERLSWSSMAELSGLFADLLEDEAIDLVDLRSSPDHLSHRILRDGKCLYASDLRTRIDFEVTVEMRYCDSVPLRNEYLNSLERRIFNGAYGR